MNSKHITNYCKGRNDTQNTLSSCNTDLPPDYILCECVGGEGRARRCGTSVCANTDTHKKRQNMQLTNQKIREIKQKSKFLITLNGSVHLIVHVVQLQTLNLYFYNDNV